MTTPFLFCLTTTTDSAGDKESVVVVVATSFRAIIETKRVIRQSLSSQSVTLLIERLCRTWGARPVTVFPVTDMTTEVVDDMVVSARVVAAVG